MATLLSLLMAESQMRMCWGPDRSRFIIPHSSSIMGGRQRNSAGLGDSPGVYGEHSTPNAPLCAQSNICFWEFLTAVQGYVRPVQCPIVEVIDEEKQKIGNMCLHTRRKIRCNLNPGCEKWITQLHLIGLGLLERDSVSVCVYCIQHLLEGIRLNYSAVLSF